MNKEMQLLNDFKLYLQDKSNIAFCTKFYTEKYELFTTEDVVNAIEELQHQLEEKDKVIDEAIKYINNTVVAEYGSEEIINIHEFWFVKKIKEILERGKNEKQKIFFNS